MYTVWWCLYHIVRRSQETPWPTHTHTQPTFHDKHPPVTWTQTSRFSAGTMHSSRTHSYPPTPPLPDTQGRVCGEEGGGGRWCQNRRNLQQQQQLVPQWGVFGRTADFGQSARRSVLAGGLKPSWECSVLQHIDALAWASGPRSWFWRAAVLFSPQYQ